MYTNLIDTDIYCTYIWAGHVRKDDGRNPQGKREDFITCCLHTLNFQTFSGFWLFIKSPIEHWTAGGKKLSEILGCTMFIYQVCTDSYVLIITVKASELIGRNEFCNITLYAHVHLWRCTVSCMNTSAIFITSTSLREPFSSEALKLQEMCYV